MASTYVSWRRSITHPLTDRDPAMLRAVTKSELWEVEDSGVLDRVVRHPTWHLKSAQDAIAHAYLHAAQGQRIGEVGGGSSRVLPSLAPRNDCFNFDVFDGRDGGPSEEVLIEGVTNVRRLVGDTADAFPGGTLDVLFSISVVEHVPTDQLGAFFRDSHRLLRPGGTMLHLIDLYVADDDANPGRLRHYLAAFDTLFTSPEPSQILDPEEFRFRCSYATNPDNVMRMWNRTVPQLAHVRAQAQLITLLMLGTAATAS